MQIACCLSHEVEETFDSIDTDRDRSITFEEFVALMHEMDSTRTEAEVRRGFDIIDSNRDGRVSFDEFQAWMLR